MQAHCLFTKVTKPWQRAICGTTGIVVAGGLTGSVVLAARHSQIPLSIERPRLITVANSKALGMVSLGVVALCVVSAPLGVWAARGMLRDNLRMARQIRTDYDCCRIARHSAWVALSSPGIALAGLAVVPVYAGLGAFFFTVALDCLDGDDA